MKAKTKKRVKRKPAKSLGINPKDAFGNKKAPLDLVSVIATAHEAFAMADGADKYGPANWRDNSVQARIYVAAAKRHMDLWLEGERVADDSHAHHLGHARACLAILLDAEATGNLTDNRPKPAVDALKGVYAEIAEGLAFRAKRKLKKKGK